MPPAASQLTSQSIPTPPQLPNKRGLKIGLVVGVVLILVGVGAGIYVLQSQGKQGTSPLTQIVPIIFNKLLTWDDPAGFTFEYPEDLVIDKHDEDQENYAHVELTHREHPGRVIVWAKDLPTNKKGVPVADAGEWVSSSAQFANANVLDSRLGGQPGKKILVNMSPRTLVVGTIYDDVLWYIEGDNLDDEFWSKAYETITTTFAFKPLPREGADTQSDGGVVVDEEEVIE